MTLSEWNRIIFVFDTFKYILFALASVLLLTYRASGIYMPASGQGNVSMYMQEIIIHHSLFYNEPVKPKGPWENTDIWNISSK